MENTPPQPNTGETSVVKPTSRANIISQYRVWWVALLIANILFTIILGPKSGGSDMPWAYALGSVVGIFVTAFVLTGIPWFVSVIARRRMTSFQFMSTFTVAAALVMASRLVVLTHESNANSGIENFNSEAGGAVFPPGNSDFVVTFSSEPTVEEFEVVTTDGVPLKGTRAELSIGDSFQRVEVVSMPFGFSETETRDSAISKLREYAFHNGITAPEFTYELSPLGRRAHMRGTKLMDYKGSQRAVTFEVAVYYGNSSLFSIYVGAPSQAYPPTRVVAFMRSVRKK